MTTPLTRGLVSLISEERQLYNWLIIMKKSTISIVSKPRERFQYFGEFDSFKIKGNSRCDQWVGRVKTRYNAFVQHANAWLDIPPAFGKLEMFLALNELGRLARLRLYELSALADVHFDANADGPGSADFICSNACEFFYFAYVARMEYVTWQCLSKRFSCLLKPHGIISGSASVISNRIKDEHPWKIFCDGVEETLQNSEDADAILGEDAHSRFLTSDDERLYNFENNWVVRAPENPRFTTVPIFADSPDYHYSGSGTYARKSWTLGHLDRSKCFTKIVLDAIRGKG